MGEQQTKQDNQTDKEKQMKRGVQKARDHDFDESDKQEHKCFQLIGDCSDRNKEDTLITVSVVLLVLGFIIMFIGYSVPRGYVFDTSLPAREMEKIEIYYAELSYKLDVCIVVGMGFIAIGGLIVSCVTTYYFIVADHQIYRKEDRPDLNLLNSSEMTTYGTSEQ